MRDRDKLNSLIHLNSFHQSIMSNLIFSCQIVSQNLSWLSFSLSSFMFLPRVSASDCAVWREREEADRGGSWDSGIIGDSGRGEHSQNYLIKLSIWQFLVNVPPTRSGIQHIWYSGLCFILSFVVYRIYSALSILPVYHLRKIWVPSLIFVILIVL